MIVYGIKSCSTVSKATKFLKEHSIDYDFFDYKKEFVDIAKIQSWLKKTDINIIFNNKGQKYRTLGLKNLNLDESGKIQWLAKDNLLLKRPIIELDNGEIIVGYNEEEYSKIFIK